MLETHKFEPMKGGDGSCRRCHRKLFEGKERTHDSTRCVTCKGCQEYAKQKAAFLATASNSVDETSRDNLLASWNAYQKDYAEELKCAVAVER